MIVWTLLDDSRFTHSKDPGIKEKSNMALVDGTPGFSKRAWLSTYRQVAGSIKYDISFQQSGADKVCDPTINNAGAGG